MDTNNKRKYLTFPVSLLKGAFENITTVCDNIFDYAIYKHSLTLNGTEEERMEAALRFYNITPGNLENMTRNGKNLIKSIPKRMPLTSITNDMIFDFYKNYKSEFDIACFCAFAAIKSIIGKKEFCKTNKIHVIARMFGCNSMKNLPENKTDLFIKYSNRYYIDKVLLELQMDWHLKLISDHIRGFYLSFEYSHEQLAKVNIEAKKATKLNKLRIAKEEALQKAKADCNLPLEERKITFPQRKRIRIRDQRQQPEPDNKTTGNDNPF